jgi:ribonuclease HII
VGKILKIGIDEAGRGPLAGPVVSAAVIIEQRIEGVKDSKKLIPKKRSLLFNEIINHAIAFGVGTASVEEIESLNILNATFLSMRRAIDSLLLSYKKQFGEIYPEDFIVLVDGNKPIPDIPFKVKAIVKGDNLIYEISCASIIAKVYRDNIMVALANAYPQYGFEKNKGYGTKEHFEALKKFGISPVHRKKFVRGLENVTLFG